MSRLIISFLVIPLIVLAFSTPAKAACFPVYGFWCGADWPPRGRNPRPIDAFDAACMRHDYCYERFGEDDRRCDAGFVQDLHGLFWQYRYLPRPLQLAERYYSTRIGLASGPPPMPMPGDIMGLLGGLLADCE